MSDCCSVKDANVKVPPVMACPVNGTRSKRVDMLTVKSLVRRLSFRMPPTQYYFCDAGGCDVVYFPLDQEAPVYRRDDLLVRVGRKETSDPIPVCYCFGVTRQNIWDEIRRTGKSTVAERINAEVKAGHCACEVKNPSGRCCLGNVTLAVREAMRTVQAVPPEILGRPSQQPFSDPTGGPNHES